MNLYYVHRFRRYINRFWPTNGSLFLVVFDHSFYSKYFKVIEKIKYIIKIINNFEIFWIRRVVKVLKKSNIKYLGTEGVHNKKYDQNLCYIRKVAHLISCHFFLSLSLSHFPALIDDTNMVYNNKDCYWLLLPSFHFFNKMCMLNHVFCQPLD
jgi:hypothetical protein